MAGELTTITQQPMNLDDTLRLGEVLAKSQFFSDAKSAAQAVVKVLAGRELGFSPMASMTGIHIIEGRPSIGAHLMASAIMRSGKYKYKVNRCDKDACEITFYGLEESGWKQETGWMEIGKVTVTMQEAQERGWTVSPKDGKTLMANWRKHPDDMLFARAISKGYRRYCPDLTGGMIVYTDGEIDSRETQDDPSPGSVPPVNGQSNQIEVEVVSVTAGKAPKRITEEQVSELTSLIKETAADTDKLLKHYQVPVLPKLTPEQFEDCKARLEKKRKPALPPVETVQPEQVLVLTNLGSLLGHTAEGLATILGVPSLAQVPARAYLWLTFMLKAKADLTDTLASLRVKSVTELREETLKSMTLSKLREEIDRLVEVLKITPEQFTSQCLKLFGTPDTAMMGIDQLEQLRTRLQDKADKLANPTPNLTAS